MDPLYFTKQQLRSFFQENRDHPVGRASSENSCPIANYFSQKRNIAVRVQVDRISIGKLILRNYEYRPLESWQREFVKVFDLRFGDKGPNCGQEALDILDEVTGGIDEY